MDTTDIASGPKELREGWHSRTISEVVARLSFLHALVKIKANKKQSPGSDIVVTLGTSKRTINIEVQQDASGTPWTTKTIPSWSERHDLLTFVIFAQPTLERVLNKLKKPVYAFFREPGVFLMSEHQISELVAIIAGIAIRSTIELPEYRPKRR